MQTIISRVERIAKLECSCCGDYHYIDISYNKKYDHKDESDYLFEFDFNWGYCNHDYPDLKSRIRNIKYMLINKNTNETIDEVLIDTDQIESLRTLMIEYINKVATENELSEALKGNKPDMTTFMINSGVNSSNWYTINLFRGEDELGFNYSYFNNEGNENASWLDGSFEIGFYEDPKEWKSTKRTRAWNYLTKQSKYGFREKYCSLTKNESLKFLSALSYILYNIKDEKELIEKTGKWRGKDIR